MQYEVGINLPGPLYLFYSAVKISPSTNMESKLVGSIMPVFATTILWNIQLKQYATLSSIQAYILSLEKQGLRNH